MSPTILRVRSYQFHFYSREESRPHVHVRTPDGKAKFWLEPQVELADSSNLAQRELRQLEELVTEYQDDFRTAWSEHFG